MATSSGRTKRKVEHDIPVTVVSRPSTRTPRAAAPTPPPKPPSIVQKKPVHSVPLAPEEHRRRVMRWSVTIGIVVILIGWLATVRYELIGASRGGNLISDIIHSFRSLKFPSTPKPSAKEQEVQQYQQEVFPQFSNVNQ